MEEYYYFPNSWGTGGYVEAGFPGHTVPRNPSSPPPPPRTRRASRGNTGAGELHHHYLDTCFRCGRHLGGNKDIFMYRGDTPFCSDECRQQQIDADEAMEKRRSRQPAVAKREREREREREPQRQSSSSSPQRIPLWAR